MSPKRLFHFSESDAITEFRPRAAPAGHGLSEPVVWGITEQMRANYLLPRACPRVTFYVTAATTAAHRTRLFCQEGARHVVAVEARWLPTIKAAAIVEYELPPAHFVELDAGAGYYIARAPITPLRKKTITDLPAAIRDCGAELRVVANLWPLWDDVVNSTVQFSMIRMRNAAPRIDHEA